MLFWNMSKSNGRVRAAEAHTLFTTEPAEDAGKESNNPYKPLANILHNPFPIQLRYDKQPMYHVGSPPLKRDL